MKEAREEDCGKNSFLSRHSPTCPNEVCSFTLTGSVTQPSENNLPLVMKLSWRLHSAPGHFNKSGGCTQTRGVTRSRPSIQFDAEVQELFHESFFHDTAWSSGTEVRNRKTENILKTGRNAQTHDQGLHQNKTRNPQQEAQARRRRNKETTQATNQTSQTNLGHCWLKD